MSSVLNGTHSAERIGEGIPAVGREGITRESQDVADPGAGHGKAG